MRNLENDRKNKIYDMVSIVKMLSLFFCAIAFFSTVNLFYSAYNQESSIGGFVGFIIFSCIIVLVYQVWNFSAKRKISQSIIASAIETSLFIVIFTTVNITLGAHLSQYKFLYLFIIITSTIQFGIQYGSIVAAISSTLILGIDIIMLPNVTVNTYFQDDLILVGVFVLTAWLLGYYVKVEKEYSDHMYNLANIDELTEVYNHRFFHEQLQKIIDDAREKGEYVSLLFIDIDFFKIYNDLYGHLAGDKVLKDIGRLLKSHIRSGDIAARYGGEEFAVVLPKTIEDRALLIAEKIRKAAEKTIFEGEDGLPNGKLTVSIGVSSFPDKAKNKSDLINNSDEALYRAKFLNKNRVESYFSILEEIKKEIEEKLMDLISSIKTLINLINMRDRYTYGHIERVVVFSNLLATELGLNAYDEKILKFGAYLHDIGKIDVPKEVLNKKTTLSNEEWNILKLHPEYGVEIIKDVYSLRDIIPLILHHHERYDGNGYPGRLKGEEIPYLVRILSIADSVDAMTSNRPYKVGKSYEEAIEELEACSGTQFDPELVPVMVKILKIKIDRGIEKVEGYNKTVSLK